MSDIRQMRSLLWETKTTSNLLDKHLTANIVNESELNAQQIVHQVLCLRLEVGFKGQQLNTRQFSYTITRL